MIRVLEPAPPTAARNPYPLAELVDAAIAWHHAHDPFPEPGTVPADMRSGRVFAAHARNRAAARERLHAAAHAYEDAPERRTLGGWLADRGLATRGDWATLALLVAAFAGITVWCMWMAGR